MREPTAKEYYDYATEARSAGLTKKDLAQAQLDDYETLEPWISLRELIAGDSVQLNSHGRKVVERVWGRIYFRRLAATYVVNDKAYETLREAIEAEGETKP